MGKTCANIGLNKAFMNIVPPIMAVCLGGLVLAQGQAIAANPEFTNSESAYLADLFAGRTVLRILIEIPSKEMRDLSRQDSNNWRQRPSRWRQSKKVDKFTPTSRFILKTGSEGIVRS